MPSQTKEATIRRLESNAFLQAPVLAPMPRSPGDLSAGNPIQAPTPSIIERAHQALLEGQTHYVPVPGIDPLREELADHLRAMGMESWGPENVLVTAGMQESRFLSIQMIGALFGSIALPEVVHPGVRQAIGARPFTALPLPVDAASGYLPTLAGMRQALETGCRLLYLESPARLTGAVFDQTALDDIARLVEEYDAAVLWDQGFGPWVQEGDYRSLGSVPGMDHRIALLGEAWPGKGLESWYIGYVGTRNDWMQPITSQKQIMAICTSTASQYAAVEAGRRFAAIHSPQVERLAAARQQALATADARGLTIVPGRTVNVLALRVDDPARFLADLRQQGIVAANGADFGAPGIVRFGVSESFMLPAALGKIDR